MTHPRQSSSIQPRLPFDQRVLPVVEDALCNKDIEITNALTPLTPYVNAAYLYQTLLALAAMSTMRNPSGNSPLLKVQIGYAPLSKHIQKNHDATLDKWALQKAVKTLEKFCYLQRTIEAHSGTEATTYALLNPEAVMKMLAQAGCTHYRILRGGKVQLIRPCLPIQPHEELS